MRAFRGKGGILPRLRTGSQALHHSGLVESRKRALVVALTRVPVPVRLSPIVLCGRVKAAPLMRRSLHQVDSDRQSVESDPEVPPPWKDRAAAIVTRMFGADLRSLAALRIALALIVLADLAGRATNLRVHYSDAGILPREVLIESLNPWRWSLNLINGTVAFQQALFVVTAIAAVWLLLGYKTRLMTVLVWALMVSIQVRNPLVLSAADTLLRLLLFWGMLLPLGAVWSIDRQRGAFPKRLSMRFVSVATAGLYLQIAFMYWFTAALKTGADWREDGSALFYALGAEQITTPFGEWAQQFPSVLQSLTFFALGIEVVAPILLFSPIWTDKLRMVAIASLMGMHLGILLTMNIGIFPWTSALCMLAFLPGSFWESVEPRVRTVVQSRFDRLGGFRDALPGALEQTARGVTQMIRTRMPIASGRRELSFSAQPAGTGAEMIDPARNPMPSGGATASHHDPGQAAEPERPPEQLRSSPLLNLVAAFCLLFVFGWNMTSVSAYTMPSGSSSVAYSLGLYQKWNMFAPRPPHATSWYVMVGTLGNGQQVEMLTPILRGDMTLAPPVTWEQPDDIAGDYYKDKYWRKYFASIADSGKTEERRQFAAYVCRTWNAAHTGTMDVEKLLYVYVSERTLPDGARGEQSRDNVASFTCAQGR